MNPPAKFVEKAGLKPAKKLLSRFLPGPRQYWRGTTKLLIPTTFRLWVLVFNSLMLLVLIHSSSLPTYPPCQSQKRSLPRAGGLRAALGYLGYYNLFFEPVFLFMGPHVCCFFANLLVQDRALSFFLSLQIYIYIYIYSRMGAPGSPNSTFYNSWAPLWGVPLKYMANRYAKTFSGLKWYVLKQFGAPGSPNSTFYNSWAPLWGAPR